MPVDDALAQADQIVDDTLAQADQTVDDTLAQTDQTVDDTLAQTDQTVDDTLAQTDAIVDDTLAEADKTVTDTLAQGNRTATGEVAGAPGGVEAAAGGPPPGANAPAVVAPTGGDASPIDAPISGSGALAGSPTRFDGGDPTGAGPADVPLGDLPFGGELLPLAEPFAESPLAGPPVEVPVDAAPLQSVGGGSGLDAIVTIATDPGVLTATGVAVVVGGGLHIWRGAPQLPEAPIMFTNVRLLPCLISDSVGDQLGAIAAALSTRGTETALQVAVSPAIAPPQGAVAKASANPTAVAQSGGGSLTRFGASFREGFGNAVEGNREIGDAGADSRLLIQLGMGLGCVYAAFLSVWFWVTRMRRSKGA
jgi:hypothetical protein